MKDRLIIKSFRDGSIKKSLKNKFYRKKYLQQKDEIKRMYNIRVVLFNMKQEWIDFSPDKTFTIHRMQN